MPEVNLSEFGKLPRSDGKPGHRLVTPTKRSFVEADGSDIRMKRVRIFDEAGNFVKSKLVDPMGRSFADNLDETEDDPNYLKKFQKKK